MTASFRIECALRCAMIAKAALAVVHDGISPRLVELQMVEVTELATQLIAVARKEAAK